MRVSNLLPLLALSVPCFASPIPDPESEHGGVVKLRMKKSFSHDGLSALDVRQLDNDTEITSIEPNAKGDDGLDIWDWRTYCQPSDECTMSTRIDHTLQPIALWDTQCNQVGRAHFQYDDNKDHKLPIFSQLPYVVDFLQSNTFHSKKNKNKHLAFGYKGVKYTARNNDFKHCGGPVPWCVSVRFPCDGFVGKDDLPGAWDIPKKSSGRVANADGSVPHDKKDIIASPPAPVPAVIKPRLLDQYKKLETFCSMNEPKNTWRAQCSFAMWYHDDTIDLALYDIRCNKIGERSVDMMEVPHNGETHLDFASQLPNVVVVTKLNKAKPEESKFLYGKTGGTFGDNWSYCHEGERIKCAHVNFDCDGFKGRNEPGGKFPHH